MFAYITETVPRRLTELYKEYSEETTVHGVKYTTQAQFIGARIFWLIILIVSLLASGLLANIFYERHKSASMNTVVVNDQLPMWKLALPAVTLCHSNIVMEQKMSEYLTSQKRIKMPRGLTRADFEDTIKYLREVVYPTNQFPEELDKLQQILFANKLSLVDLFESVGPNCNDFLVMCQFHSETLPCKKLFTPIVTPFGVCCSFHHAMQNGFQRANTSMNHHRSYTFGTNFVLSIVMKYVPLHDRLSSIMYGDGIQVMIHEKYAYPGATSLEFMASPGYETIAQLYGYRLANSRDVLSLSFGNRGCISPPATGYPYRADNCHIQCEESVIRRLCNCVPFFVSEFYVGDQVCNLTHVPCLAHAKPHIYSITEKDPYCNCLPECKETSFRVAVTALPLSAMQHSPVEIYKKALQYSNATVLHISLSSQSGLMERRVFVLPNISLASSLGGVFGLFIGCSLISVVEIFYFFCISPTCKSWQWSKN